MAEIPCKNILSCRNKNHKDKIIKSLCLSYYMPQNPQNITSQTTLNNYNKFRSVRTEALIWLKIATDKGKKLKSKTIIKEKYQPLFGFITIDLSKN